MSDGCQIGVIIVTAQSTRHMHYIQTCLSGSCMVFVTITVTTNSCTKETLCFRFVTAQSTRHMHYITVLRMGVGWASDGCRISVGSPTVAMRISWISMFTFRHTPTIQTGCL